MVLLKDILNKFDLDLPITENMKNIEIMDSDYNPFSKYNIENDEYIFRGKFKNKEIYWTVVVNLDKMIVECDTWEIDEEFSSYEIYDETGEMVESA